MKCAATQGARAVIGTLWHSGPCADKPGDLRAPLVQQQQWCYVSRWPFITREAGCTAVPFAIWHRHAVLACDRCCTTVVPGVTNDLLDCLFLFFPVTKNYLFDDGHQCNPRLPWWTRRSLPLVFWDHIYLKWSVSLCVCVCVVTAGLRYVHVQEDALLANHISLDSFKSA